MTVATKEALQSTLAIPAVPELNGTAIPQPPLKRLFTLEEFAQIAHALPDDRMELINGEIIMAPPPDDLHMRQTVRTENLLIPFYQEIARLGGSITGSSLWYAVPIELKNAWAMEGVKGPNYVCPDASICFGDYPNPNNRPPAMLVIEVISVSAKSEIDRDLVQKPDIYASLEIPTYWVIDRRDKSVWVHTEPEDGKYTSRVQVKGDNSLPATGMEFLNITPSQIFS